MAIGCVAAGDVCAEAAVASAPPASRLVFCFDAPRIERTDRGFKVTLDGCEEDGDPGAPKLPVRGVTLPVPPQCRPGAVRITAGGTTAHTLDGPLLCIQQAIPLSAPPARLAPTPRDPILFSRRTPYPAFDSGEGTRKRVDRRRGADELTLTLHPVQVVPAENRLLCHAELTVEVAWVPVAPEVREARTQQSPRLAPTASTTRDGGGAPAEGGAVEGAPLSFAAGRPEHIIIAPVALVSNTPAPWNLDALVAARREAGLTSAVVELEWIYAHYAGRDSAERIRAFIRDAYEQCATRYVLLVGTSQLLPTRNLYCSFSGYTALIPSDALYYGCLDGDFDSNGNNVFGEIGDGVGGGDVDLVAEVQVGRFPVADAAELSRLIRKTLAYEAEPAARLASVASVGEYLWTYNGVEGYATGAMEQIRLGAYAAGVTTLGFENPDYGDRFDTDWMLYDAPGYRWPTADILDLMNRNVHVFNHLGHGAPRICFKLNLEVESDRLAVAGLTNDLYHLVYSQACEAGRFDDVADCFAEQIVTAPAGAFAALMNARYGWGYLGSDDGPSQRFHRMFWDGIFSHQAYHLGAANALSKERLRHLVDPQAGNVFRWCYYEITLFGDPATPFAARALRQAPVLTHAGLPNQFDSASPYEVTVELGPVSLYDPATPRLVWRTSADPDGIHTNPLTRIAGSRFAAEIPPQPQGTTVRYALHAETLGGVAGSWPSAGEHAFAITPAFTLEIRGDPETWGTVDPAYGLHTVASGMTVRATAPARVVEPGGVSRALRGFDGSGSVAAAPLPTADIVISEPSVLTWLWQTEYALLHTSNVPGLLTAAAWFPPGVVTSSAVAPDSTVWLGQTHRFAGWSLDGQRQPDAPGAAWNPIPAIAMTTSRVAFAHYLPDTMDADGNGIPDWWEHRYFGANGQPPDADDDGDGFTTAQEYADRTDPLDPESYPQAPTIVHAPLAASQATPPPFAIRAEISDSLSVASAHLLWRRNDEPWRTNALTRGTGDTYTAQIPAPGEPRDCFEYRIVASDPAGQEAVHGPHVTTLVYPRVARTPADGRQTLLTSGGEAESALILTNTGNASLVWRLAHGFYEAVADPPTAWTTNALGQPWRVSSARCASPPFAFHGQPLSVGSYFSPAVRSGLLSPPLQPAPGARLFFRHWIDTELDARQAGWAFDGAILEISTDQGESFQQLDGPYTHRIAGWSYSPWPDGTPCLAGDGSAGWQEVVFDLDAYAGQTVRLRFHVGGDNNTDREGWYVDDIRVGPVLEPAWPAWIACGATAGTVIPGRGISVPVYLMADGAPHRDVLLPIHILSNDPVAPNLFVDWSLKLRDPPWVGAAAAAQTSTNGEGVVTLMTDVAEADGEPLHLEIACSTDGGLTWFDTALADARSALGICALNAASSRVEQIATSVGGLAVTNTVSALWETRATLPPLPPLAPDVRMRVRAVSPYFASPPLVTEPFLVDNEPPPAPEGLAVTTHAVGVWSGSAAMQARWDGVTDGAGVGGVVYRRRLSESAADTLEGAARATAADAAFSAMDGSNLWFAVQAVDAAGNASATARIGPYCVDTAPPLSAGAFVRARRSAFGPYAVGPALTADWGGFSDALSGVAGYYVFGLADGHFASPVFSATPAATLSQAAPGLTNQVLVFAVDRVGNASAMVGDSVLLLDPQADHDGDGYVTADEEVAGTDATNPASVLRLGLAGTRALGNAVTLDVVWDSLSGRRYTLLATPSLTAPDWRPVSGLSEIPGVGARVTNSVTLASPAFLRLSVSAEP